MQYSQIQFCYLKDKKARSHNQCNRADGLYESADYVKSFQNSIELCDTEIGKITLVNAVKTFNLSIFTFVSCFYAVKALYIVISGRNLCMLYKIKTGNNDAWEIICRNFDGYIHKCCRKRLERFVISEVKRKDLEEDMYMAGWQGFVNSLKKYNPEKSKFLTFATYYIDGEIFNFIIRDDSIFFAFIICGGRPGVAAYGERLCGFIVAEDSVAQNVGCVGARHPRAADIKVIGCLCLQRRKGKSKQK